MLRELSNVTGRKLKVIYGVKNVGEIRIEDHVVFFFQCQLNINSF